MGRKKKKAAVTIQTLGSADDSVATPITEHEGRKYLREIHSATNSVIVMEVDVYCVLEAFEVTCPATAQAVKKLLCAGQRGKGNRLEDLVGALAALNRAIEMEQQKREG